jgi:hypothetical protein
MPLNLIFAKFTIKILYQFKIMKFFIQNFRFALPSGQAGSRSKKKKKKKKKAFSDLSERHTDAI